MSRQRKPKREQVDKFKIKNGEIAAIVVNALLADGYDIDIAAGVELAGVCGDPVPSGSIITVYGKRGKQA